MNDMQVSTIKEIVTSDYRTAGVFEKYSLDFCCGGGKTIEQACKEKSVNSAMVFEDLKNTVSGSLNNESKFSEMGLDELIDYILNTQHCYVLHALPAILTHTRKVATVHGERHPEVIRIADRFTAVAEELQHHMMKEERILFPSITSLVSSKKLKFIIRRPSFGSAGSPRTGLNHHE